MIAYPNIAERLFGRPHAIDPVALRAIMDGPLARRVLSGDKIEAKQGKKNRAVRYDRLAAVANAEPVRSPDGLVDYGLTPDGVAVLPISGVLSRRFDWLAAACGFATYDSIGATFDAAMADFRVRAVLFDVDSPGGDVDGMLDLADAILAARGQDKPIWAVANSCAASAAYALAGSASRLFLPRLGRVGSIGCVAIHVDQSAADKAMGVNYTAIYSGTHKIDGWGHAPLTDAARNSAQAGVDHVRDEFAALIGRQGRLSAAAAMATEAAVFADTAAVEAGLADAVGTFADALGELTAEVSPSFSGAKRMSATTTVIKPNATKANATTTAVVDPKTPAVDVAGVAAATTTTETAASAAAAESGAAQAADMTPPKAGEKCDLCGQVAPDEPGQNDATKAALATTTAAAAAGAAAAVVPAYGQAEIDQTLELCQLAGASAKVAHDLIRAKAPIVKVRETLLEARAVAADGQIITRVMVTGDGDGTSSSEAIIASKREMQKRVKAEMGIRSKA